MKKIIFLTIGIILLSLILILNIEVTTRQGINHRVQTLKIPLYLKILDFYDRYYNYKRLAHKVTVGKTGQKDKIMALFKWTHENIREQPNELPVVDDHVWHIIVRGYGTGDQFSDVFTTLCNYINTDAFFSRLASRDKTDLFPFSFVKIGDRWCLFEPHRGVYFKNREEDFASLEDIAQGNWSAVGIEDSGSIKLDYAEFFLEIPTLDPEGHYRFSRANIQSPLNRFFYEIKKRRAQE